MEAVGGAVTVMEHHPQPLTLTCPQGGTGHPAIEAPGFEAHLFGQLEGDAAGFHFEQAELATVFLDQPAMAERAQRLLRINEQIAFGGSATVVAGLHRHRPVTAQPAQRRTAPCQKGAGAGLQQAAATEIRRIVRANRGQGIGSIGFEGVLPQCGRADFRNAIPFSRPCAFCSSPCWRRRICGT